MPTAVDNNNNNNNEDSSSRYIKEDLHTVFRFSAKLQFAETICRLDPIPGGKVQILLDACPYPSLDELKMEREEYFHAVSMLVGFRTQESVLAIAHFFLCSNGQFENEIVSRLNSYLEALGKLKFPDSATIVSAENFTYHLVKQFAYIAESIGKSRQALITSFLDFYQYVIQINNLPIMYGALRALGEVCFPLTNDQAKVISMGLDNIIGNVAHCVEYKDVGGQTKPMLVMVLQVIEQLTYLPTPVFEDLCEQFYHVAQYFALEHRPQPDVAAAVHIVQLMVRIAVCSPRLSDRVYIYLLDSLSERSLRARFPQDVSSQAVLDAVPFFQAILHGLDELATRYPPKIAKMLDPIRHFILNGAPVRASPPLREDAIATVCQILRVEMVHVGVEAPRQLINSLFGVLYPYFNASTAASSTASSSTTTTNQMITTVTTALAPDNPLHTVIPLLGRITCALDDPKITEIVMPNFISRISYPPTEMDVLMLEQLTAIALLGQQSSTNEVVLMMVNLFKKIVKDPNHGLIINTIPNALHNLAIGLTNAKLKQDFCKKILKLFQQLGKEVSVSAEGFEQNFSNPLLKGMGFLLPTIAVLCQNNVVNPDDITVKLFQSAWFYCTLFRFTNSGTWRSDWLDAVTRLAIEMPTLTTGKSNLYLEMEFELGSILKQGFQKDEFAQMRGRLTAAIPSQTVNVRNLSFPATAYLLSVYTLETLRVKAGSFRAVFTYLEDQGINNIYVTPCLRAIADVVFADFLNLVAAQGASEKREQHLVEHTEFLLVNFCNSVEAVRKAADDYISQMVAKFPQILWSKDCLCTLMELLECVARGAGTLPLEVISLTLPSTGYVLDLPEDTQGRHRLLTEVVQLCSIWLKNGLQHATMETHSVLQEYMLGFQGLVQRHIGVSLALEVGSYHNSLSEEEREMPIPLKDKSVKAAFLVMLGPTVVTASASNADQQAISSLELLTHVCWVPVKIFTPESMEAGVAAWEWLLCERPDLGMQVMSGLFDAWVWTVDSRMGLFSKAHRPPNPLAITSQPAGLNVQRVVSTAHVPHRIWLKFLEERFAVVRHSNREQLGILLRSKCGVRFFA